MIATSELVAERIEQETCETDLSAAVATDGYKQALALVTSALSCDVEALSSGQGETIGHRFSCGALDVDAVIDRLSRTLSDLECTIMRYRWSPPHPDKLVLLPTRSSRSIVLAMNVSSGGASSARHETVLTLHIADHVEAFTEAHPVTLTRLGTDFLEGRFLRRGGGKGEEAKLSRDFQRLMEDLAACVPATAWKAALARGLFHLEW